MKYLDAESERRLRVVGMHAFSVRHENVVVKTQASAKQAAPTGGWLPVAIEVYADWLTPIVAPRHHLTA